MPTDAVRRRVADHIRGALASKETRERLVRGNLSEEVEPRGFDAYAGLPVPKTSSRAAAARAAKDVDRDRRTREKKLKAEISRAKAELAEGERRVRAATRERDELARRVEELEAQLDSG
jgi:hypothetical protein